MVSKKTLIEVFVGFLVGALLILFIPVIVGSEYRFSRKTKEEKLAREISKGDIPKIKKILEDRIDLESTDSSGDPMLHIALGYGYVTRAKNYKVKRSPVEREKVIYEMVSVLLKNGAKINSLDNYQFTPLAVAVSRDLASIVDLLLENNADVNLKNKSGNTALQIAAQMSSKLEIIKLLLEKGAKLNIKNNDGQTPIDIAEEQGNKEIVELLLKYKENSP